MQGKRYLIQQGKLLIDILSDSIVLPRLYACHFTPLNHNLNFFTVIRRENKMKGKLDINGLIMSQLNSISVGDQGQVGKPTIGERCLA